MATRPEGYSPIAPHHYYWGIIVCLIGFPFVFYGPWILGVILFVIGVWWMADDLVQHLHQGHDILCWKADPAHTSPVHNWYWSILSYLRERARLGSTWSRLLEWLAWH